MRCKGCEVVTALRCDGWQRFEVKDVKGARNLKWILFFNLQGTSDTRILHRFSLD